MMFVETASRYGATIQVRRMDGDEHVDGKSIMQMMMLAATCGTELVIIADGEDAEHAIDELTGLVESNFQEE